MIQFAQPVPTLGRWKSLEKLALEWFRGTPKFNSYTKLPWVRTWNRQQNSVASVAPQSLHGRTSSCSMCFFSWHDQLPEVVSLQRMPLAGWWTCRRGTVPGRSGAENGPSCRWNPMIFSLDWLKGQFRGKHGAPCEISGVSRKLSHPSRWSF